MSRIVVNVSTGGYVAGLDRLRRAIPDESILAWRDGLPDGSPTHQDVPYAFKSFAIAKAVELGHTTILWADASIVPIKPLEPLWQLIETQGYWIANNGWNTGQWCCDSALGPLGITREEAFGIPHPVATSFGLDFRHEIAREFFRQWFDFAKDGRAFRGPWRNDEGQASRDPRVMGHRHDQAVMGVIVHRLGMKLIDPPKWLAYHGSERDDTVLSVRGQGQ